MSNDAKDTSEPSGSGLPETVPKAIADANTTVSLWIASVWKMAIEAGLAKRPKAAEPVQIIEAKMEANGFEILPIAVQRVRAAGHMQSPHRVRSIVC